MRCDSRNFSSVWACDNSTLLARTQVGMLCFIVQVVASSLCSFFSCFVLLVQFKSMSTEWMQTNLQYEKSRFGYVLPDEVEGDERFLQKLSAVSFLRSFKPGEVMLAPDSDERLLFHVMKGCVLVYSSTGTPLLDVVAGEIAGESRFLQPNPCGSVAKIVARDRVKCLVTPFEAVQALCSIDPMFSARFHRGLAIAIAGCPLYYNYFPERGCFLKL